MKNHSKPVMRREFLKTGFAGGAVLAVFPFKKLLSLYDSPIKSNSNRSNNSHNKLQEIVREYGSEFGAIKLKD